MCFGAIIIIDVVCAYSSIRWRNNISMRDVSFAVQSGYIVKCMGGWWSVMMESKSHKRIIHRVATYGLSYTNRYILLKFNFHLPIAK